MFPAWGTPGLGLGGLETKPERFDHVLGRTCILLQGIGVRLM